MKNPVYWVVLAGISIALIQQDGRLVFDFIFAFESFVKSALEMFSPKHSTYRTVPKFVTLKLRYKPNHKGHRLLCSVFNLREKFVENSAILGLPVFKFIVVDIYRKTNKDKINNVKHYGTSLEQEFQWTLNM
ncbi:hypothetical protein ROHU_010739 [Labeo rohita]|uniref:Uncharacterized protein n=1 Tax=Labeo rohita TaxID=84645 RepID=A0A498LUX5_LABRO|nr:hypothetical protein ROHU_010739 [Labeo rohita]